MSQRENNLRFRVQLNISMVDVAWFSKEQNRKQKKEVIGNGKNRTNIFISLFAVFGVIFLYFLVNQLKTNIYTFHTLFNDKNQKKQQTLERRRNEADANFIRLVLRFLFLHCFSLYRYYSLYWCNVFFFFFHPSFVCICCWFLFIFSYIDVGFKIYEFFFTWILGFVFTIIHK